LPSSLLSSRPIAASRVSSLSTGSLPSHARFAYSLSFEQPPGGGNELPHYGHHMRPERNSISRREPFKPLSAQHLHIDHYRSPFGPSSHLCSCTLQVVYFPRWRLSNGSSEGVTDSLHLAEGTLSAVLPLSFCLFRASDPFCLLETVVLRFERLFLLPFNTRHLLEVADGSSMVYIPLDLPLSLHYW